MSTSFPRLRGKTWALWGGLLLGAAGLALIVGEFWYLQMRQDARAVAWANQIVAAKIETARAHLDRQNWDEALRVLEEALGTERATDFDTARDLLLIAQQEQARVLLNAARTAVARRDVPQALRLLGDYLAHPQATEAEQATLLRTEIERATSDAEAIRQLEHLSDDALATLARTGKLGEESFRDQGARALFQDTLQRHLPAEQHKRAARRAEARAEAARREARVRASPAFRDLAAFAADLRAKHKAALALTTRQEKALQMLFAQLGVVQPAEQAKIRRDLTEKREGNETWEEAAVRQRDAAKKAFRRTPEVEAADAALFDALADQEINRLLKDLRNP